MSFRLESIFTHVDDLEEEKDSKVLKPICVKIDGFPHSATTSDNNPEAPAMSKPIPVQSLAGLLQAASMKVYRVEPIIFRTCGLFRTECQFKDYIGVGISKNKKSSKHLAARNVLLQIVDTDDHIRFGIPGHDKDSAKTYINGLMPELQNEEVKSAPVKVNDVSGPEAQDWISRCILLCINRKVGYQPVYDFPKEEGPPNNKTFHCTATVNSSSLEQPLSVTATGRDKKSAKQMAAKKLPSDRAELSGSWE
ncbi:double-stranded RNA binding motif domain-containing protein [Ditylenchus destructor]|nr:double-stranded RNA binding motif domain-containing protein [Ditylenchus destructor]